MEIPLKKKSKFYSKFYELNLPIFISQLFLVVVGIINSLIFGQLGEKVLASMAIVDKLNGIYWPILTAVSTVISIYLLQNNEINNRKEIKKIFIICHFIMVTISLITLVIITIFGSSLLTIYTDNIYVVQNGMIYLWAIAIANVFATISYGMITYFNGIGKVRETSIVGIFQVVTNFLLYYLFVIWINDGIVKGIRGISLAIIVTKILELIFYMKIYNAKFSLRDIVFNPKTDIDKDLLKNIISYMSPLVVNNIFFMIATNIIFISFSKMGVMETAAYGITDSIIGYFYLLMQGMVTATKIIIGGLLGKNKMKKAELYSKKIIKIMIGASAVCSVFINILASMYLKYYKIDESTRSLSVNLIFIASIFFIPKMVNLLIIDGMLRIGGDIKKPIFNDMLGIFGFGVLLSIVFTKGISVNVYVLYILVNSHELVRVILNYNRYKKKIWQKKTI